MATTFAIRIRHIDGSRTRKYATLAGAVKAFEAMVGYPIKNAIEEHYWELIQRTGKTPTAEDVNYLHAVTDNGGTVEFIRKTTAEE